MDLGAFSVSLSVSDLGASRAFYEGLGFEVVGGGGEAGYLMLRNGEHVLGLFQGMFDDNILTFNPGWTQRGEPVGGPFTDVRELQRMARERGLMIVQPIEGAPPSGPASFTLRDPDGNLILIDQHV